MDTTRPSLLIRVRDGKDRAAWYEFDSIYRPLLQRFGLARGLTDTEAEEVAQQCMAAVNRYIAGFNYDPKKGRFKAWLATMVRNRIKNLRRARRELQADSRDFQDLREPGPTPDEVFDKLWRQEHLKHCLRLVKREVEVSTFRSFVAYVIEEQSIEQVCAAFQMTANQVHAIKSRMVKRIRRHLSELLGNEE